MHPKNNTLAIIPILLISVLLSCQQHKNATKTIDNQKEVRIDNGLYNEFYIRQDSLDALLRIDTFFCLNKLVQTSKLTVENIATEIKATTENKSVRIDFYDLKGNIKIAISSFPQELLENEKACNMDSFQLVQSHIDKNNTRLYLKDLYRAYDIPSCTNFSIEKCYELKFENKKYILLFVMPIFSTVSFDPTEGLLFDVSDSIKFIPLPKPLKRITSMAIDDFNGDSKLDYVAVEQFSGAAFYTLSEDKFLLDERYYITFKINSSSGNFITFDKDKTHWFAKAGGLFYGKE
jgi:hypothetical protein